MSNNSQREKISFTISNNPLGAEVPSLTPLADTLHNISSILEGQKSKITRENVGGECMYSVQGNQKELNTILGLHRVSEFKNQSK